MIAPPVPTDEIERIAALCRLHILDTPPEERFDRITRTAQRLFGVPIALVSLVDRERQWFKSRRGLDAIETPRQISFCGHAILADGPFIINDTLGDERFADNPLVTGELGLRFYAGMPLHEQGGWRVGTLCLLGKTARDFTPADIDALADLAQWAETELNLFSIEHATRITREKESRLRAVIENAGDAIISIDADGMVDTFNPAAQRLFGYAPHAILGKPGVLLAARRFRGEIADYIDRLSNDGISEGERINRQVFGRCRDGKRFPANVVVSEMHVGGRRGFTAIVRDISERRRTAETMKKLNRQLAETLTLQKAILNSTNYAIISVNAKGKVTMFNDGAQRMLGYAASEMRVQEDLVKLHDPAELVQRMQVLSAELGRPIRPGADIFIAKVRERQTDEAQWTYICKSGKRIPILLSITGVWDEDGKLNGFVGVAHDMSEVKRVEQMKNEFIATLSHELRTPLTSIRGSLGLIAGGATGELPPMARKMVDVANKNCERLVRLINDILDVEKIESGSMRFEAATQPLLPLVEQAVAATHSYAGQYGVSFDLRSEPGDLLVSVDGDRMLQVIVNLLSNASKFAPKGDVVEIRLKRVPGFARLSVIDRGTGIPDEFRDRIFQKFAQADGADNRQKGGTGLGLNITKAIVDRHGGRIDFVSEPGVRTEFFVELPLLDAAPDTLSSTASE